MDGMQHYGERCDGGKEQSADVGGSGDFAVKFQLIERFGRSCFGGGPGEGDRPVAGGSYW